MEQEIFDDFSKAIMLAMNNIVMNMASIT
ncbi:hypothetical protein [Latilactobacillus phage TMW 1.2272 P1]|nr:hypothetical protein [Latilactobacillus phage TMW 1.2272 P1]